MNTLGKKGRNVLPDLGPHCLILFFNDYFGKHTDNKKYRQNQHACKELISRKYEGGFSLIDLNIYILYEPDVEINKLVKTYSYFY